MKTWILKNAVLSIVNWVKSYIKGIVNTTSDNVVDTILGGLIYLVLLFFLALDKTMSTFTCVLLLPTVTYAILRGIKRLEASTDEVVEEVKSGKK